MGGVLGAVHGDAVSRSSHRAEVDAARCVGTGDCARIAPQAFRLDEAEAVSRVLPTVTQASWHDLLDAALNCPVQAIRVFDAHGREFA